MLASFPSLPDTILTMSDEEDDDQALLDLLSLPHIFRLITEEMFELDCFKVVVNRVSEVFEELCKIPAPFSSTIPPVNFIN